MGNPVTQWQIISKDPEKHAAFYASVFGWKISSGNPLGYRMAETGSEKGISGGFWPAPPEVNAFVQLFAEIRNMDQTVKRFTDHGGTVLIPPQTLPAGEQMAILRDPFGLTFGV